VNVIAAVSTVANLVGAAITAVGFAQTWRDFAPEGEHFWQPPIGLKARAVLRRLRLLRSRQVTVSGTLSTTFSAHGSITVTMARLPGIDDPRLQAEVQNRIDRVHAEQQAEQERAVAALQMLRHDMEAVHADLLDRIKGTESLTRNVAVGGVRLEAFGLAIVAVSTVVGAFAQ